MTDSVTSCLQGRISPQVAVSHMLLGGMDAAGIAAAIQAGRPAGSSPEWMLLASLVEGRHATLDQLAAEIRQTGSNHSAVGGIAGIAAFFDRAVAHSPEAGVALYSLGDPALLEAATAEIVGWLHAEGLSPPGARVLDFGCGIGRVAAPLATEGRTVLGVDVSPRMVAEARRRHDATPGLCFEVTTGEAVPDGPFDLILLADSMPYVFQAGVADTVIAAMAEALAPGGAIVVMNLSYGRTEAEDLADIERWAAWHALAMRKSAPFSLWDGRAFILLAPPAPGR